MPKIFNKILFFSILLLISTISFATHNRAGEITYEHLSGNTYKITLITYTYTPSAANETRDVLPIQWGDDTESDIPRISIINLPDLIQKNTYIGTHTFPGVGVYQIVMSDPNRNADINNIPNSVGVVFTVKTILKIDATIGHNSTPIMLNPPVDKAALHQKFIHNPNAFDADGDSLSYKLAVCLGLNGLPIYDYSYPAASTELYVDPVTGDFVWDAPIEIGEYNVAMEIEEWRNGIKIGSIIRDMQIAVAETDNVPPVIQNIPDYCVLAGDNLSFNVTATDTEDNITLTASGGPFEFSVNPAQFPEVLGASPVTGTFSWNTVCEHVRKLPYDVLFRAVDDNSEVNLTDYETVKIQVVAPSPENLTVNPTSNSVILSWDNYQCSNASGFLIYRKHGTYSYTPNNCNTGLPESSGYIQIAKISGSDITNFTDNNNNTGLPQGYNYCYRISAYFEDEAESYISNEACTELIKAAPIITKTSVSNTDKINGSIHLTWMKPTEFDHIVYPGPYKYILKSAEGQVRENFTNPVNILGINDTTYIDTLINTQDTAHSYQITLYNQNGANWEQIGSSSHSSSLFINGIPGNKRMTILLNDSTPWTNKQYVIYRKDADEECNPNTAIYDSITTVASLKYTDKNLINDNHYWYLIKSIGEYDLSFIPKPLINYSQEACYSPHDTIPPCPVSLSVSSDCDLMSNFLNWDVNISEDCVNDIDNFFIYYSDTSDGALQIIDTITDNTIRTYVHYPEKSLGACYVVSAQDSAGNYIEPEKLIKVCIDECKYYELPNVFTPNNDGINDLFKPYPYKFVEKIDMTIYNRWGNEVFKTEDPDINWNGIDQETNKPVTDGVYYYVCDVYERRLSGIEVRNIAGFIRIFANTGNGGKE